MELSDIERVTASFKRCMAHMEFIDSFYQRFMETSAEVTEKFRTVDMDHQAVMLRGSLELMMGTLKADDPGAALQALAELHGRRGVDISPRLYEYWMTSLKATVRVYDKECDAALLQAWERVLEPGLSIMKRAY